MRTGHPAFVGGRGGGHTVPYQKILHGGRPRPEKGPMAVGRCMLRETPECERIQIYRNSP